MVASLSRLPRRQTRRRAAAGHGLAHLLFGALSLGVPLLLLLVAAGAVYVGAVRYFSPRAGVAQADSRESAPQSELYRLASIVFVPWTGVESCEMRRFDNETGRIIYDGTVACDFPPPAEDKNQSLQLRLSGEKTVTAAERMRAIHEAFKK